MFATQSVETRHSNAGLEIAKCQQATSQNSSTKEYTYSGLENTIKTAS